MTLSSISSPSRGPGAWLTSPGLPQPPGGGPQPREVFKGLVKGSGGPGDGEACPGWAAGPRPETQQEGQACRPLGRSLYPGLSLPPSPPALGHPLYFLRERHLSSEVQRSQEAVGDPGNQCPFPTCGKWGGVRVSGRIPPDTHLLMGGQP